MAYWDSTISKIIHYPPEDVAGCPGWQVLDCGCCGGLQWGGDSPRECRDCGGSGTIFLHVKSGTYADYPGGPFRGKQPKSQIAV